MIKYDVCFRTIRVTMIFLVTILSVQLIAQQGHTSLEPNFQVHDPSGIKKIVYIPEPDFEVHDPSNIKEIAPNVYSCFTSTHPDQSHHMRQIVLDMNDDNPQWEEKGHWPIEPRGENPIPGFMEWEIEWCEQYGYDRNLIEHTKIASD